MPHCILLLLSASMRVWLRRMAIPEPQEWTYKFPPGIHQEAHKRSPPKKLLRCIPAERPHTPERARPNAESSLLPALSFEQFLVSDPLRVFRVSDLQPICMLC